MIKKILYTTTFLFIAVVSASCAKSVMDCDYTLRTEEEVVKNQKPYEYTGDVMVFAYRRDTMEWEPASYEDALQGILTSKTGGGSATPDFIGTTSELGVYEFNFTEAPVMLVVCHTEYPVYGWRDSGIVENLPKMNIPAIFRLWKYESENEKDLITADEFLENDGGWKMVYELKR